MQVLPALQRRGSFGVAVKELKLSYHILGTWKKLGFLVIVTYWKFLNSNPIFLETVVEPERVTSGSAVRSLGYDVLRMR